MPLSQDQIEFNPAYQMMTGTVHQLNTIQETLAGIDTPDANKSAEKIAHALEDLAEAQGFLEAHLKTV